MEIFKTNDYSKFKIVLSNREVDKAHVKKLAASIRKKNLLFVRPLIVNDRMQIIDGQHRLAACEQIKAPVFYIKCSGLTKEDIAVLNTAQKNWTRLDFINFYAIEGRNAFKELSRIINKYSVLKVSFILRALGECRRLREGLITLSNKDQALQAFDYITALYTDGHRFCAERDFGLAFIDLITNRADFNRLCRQITTDNFFKCAHQSEYKKMLKQILLS